MKKNDSIYKTAAYCRKSHDDGDNTESESVSNQRRLIEDFCARRNDLDMVSCYADDGCTGTNFDRPDFKRMVADIKAGLIQCVVVKDLSRFGRDYIDMGYYLERFFPKYGVRFIAINDRIDSGIEPYDLTLPLRNVFNAQFAKDTSDKVRKTFRAKQERGESVSAFAPYGYAKDPERRNHFIIDPEAAAVVRRIYGLYAQGFSLAATARTLNLEQIPSPLTYKHRHGIPLQCRQTSGISYWSSETVRTILKNEVYRGNMASNRYPSDRMHGKCRPAPSSEWIIVNGTHEAVVTQAQWAAVQERLSKSRAAPSPTKSASLFRGLIRCGDCGHALKKRGGNSTRYCCTARRTYGSFACSNFGISEDVLIRIVLDDLNRVIQSVSRLNAIIHSSALWNPPLSAASADRKRAEAAINRISRRKQSDYEAYRGGTLTREEFTRRKAAYGRQEKALKIPLEQGDPSQAQKKAPPWVEKLLKLGCLTELDRQTLEQAVKQIRVFSDGRIEITYQFSEELRGIIERAGQS